VVARCLLVGFAVLAASAALSSTGSRAAANDAPRDLTFEGDLVRDTGTITLSLTPDLMGITRARIRDFSMAVAPPPTYAPITFTMSQEVYYDPPVPIRGQEFQLFVTANDFGMLHSYMRIRGTVQSPRAITGTAEFYAGTSYLPSVDWGATSYEPSTPSDAPTVAARLIGHPGSIIVTMDPQHGTIDAVSLQDVSLAPCSSGDPRTTLRIHVEPPAPAPSLDRSVLLSRPDGPLSIRLQGAVSGDGAAEGTLDFGDADDSDCHQTFAWSTRTETPAAPPTLTTKPTSAAPALPPTGNGPPRHGSAPIVLLELLVIASALLSTFSLARRRADQDT
jgi:hypothetical protein